jgi:hypothetical protein
MWALMRRFDVNFQCTLFRMHRRPFKILVTALSPGRIARGCSGSLLVGAKNE